MLQEGQATQACRALTVCRGVDIVQYFEHGSLSAVILSVGRLKLEKLEHCKM